MSADELWAAKLKFLEQTERELRRELSSAERVLLRRIFDRIIMRLTTEAGKVPLTAENMRVIDQLGRVFAEFTTDHMVKITAEFAKAALKTIDLSRQYFTVQGGGAGLSKVTKEADRFIRDRIGLTTSGGLKPDGFLQELIEDNTVRQNVRLRIMRAINDGGDLTSIRNRVREYLTPEKVGKVQPPGAVEKQFAKYAFDTLQRADRSTNMAYAEALDLVSAQWTGGLIETSRCMCQKLNAKVWTREELEAIDKTTWDGKDGSIFISAGGYQCRHVLRWLGMASTLRLRPDLERVDGKLAPRVGVAPQAFNKCIERKKGKR